MKRSALPWLKLLAWLCAIGLAVASLAPSGAVVRTGFPGSWEHVLAYSTTTAAFLRAYPHRQIWTIAAGLIAYAALLESGQLIAPGRTAQIGDFVSSSLGIVVTTVLGNRLIALGAGVYRAVHSRLRQAS